MPSTNSSVDPVLPPPQRLRSTSYARLSSIVNDARVGNGSENAGQIVINFPCMPETVDLTRRANYNNVLQTPSNPDGQHVYQHTDPLEIPIEFTAHSYDSEFVGDDGPVALLAVAARLHALTVPLFASGTFVRAASPAAPISANASGASESEVVENVRKANRAEAGKVLQTFFPAPCVLQLIDAKWKGTNYGVVLHGFVRDVSVQLKGPWLYGGPGLENLPSSALFRFTFVHEPGYSNSFYGSDYDAYGAGNLLGVSALSQDIYSRFYNQAELSRLCGATGDDATRAIFGARYNGLVNTTPRIPG